MRRPGGSGQLSCSLKRAARSIWLGAFLLAACTAQPAVLPTAAPSEAGKIPVQATEVERSSPTPAIPRPPGITPSTAPTFSPSPTQVQQEATTKPVNPTPTPECGPNWCIYPGHFIFQRPIQDEPFGQVDPTYRFGSTAGGVREPHSGVEFQAPAGDAVLAAAAGKVAVVVREDQVPEPGVGIGYGNMVVLQHVQPGSDVPVYSVYGHLSKIEVSTGQEVEAGTIIGRVGATGIATGPHLHFEVRFGSDLQADTRNPEMWLLPKVKDAGQNSGAMAGRIQTADGQLVDVVGITIQPVDPVSGKVSLPAIYLQTYANAAFHGDDTWGENFAAGDILPGLYRVAFSYGGKVYSNEAPVKAGQLTVIKIPVESH